ncbi:MAG: hypothetical protein NXI32_17910 [bacterium]|nr:hypothetical protein [bacterium]
MDTAREDSLKFLHGIEQRHDQLLDQLEQLNGRIEQVLGEYQKSREQNDPTADGADGHRESEA